MIKELAKEIVKEVDNKLNEIYNHRKAKLGLVSAQNTLIDNLRRRIDVWYKEQVEWEKTQASPKKAQSYNKCFTATLEASPKSCPVCNSKLIESKTMYQCSAENCLYTKDKTP